MKILYFIRVVFLSFEFLIILAAFSILNLFSEMVASVLAGMHINEELIKWLIFLPITLFGWCVKEARDLVVDGQERGRVLVNWPDYWRLKVHVMVALFFSFIFMVFAAIPWVCMEGVGTSEGFVIFFASCLGSFVVTWHVYLAKISMNEAFLLD